MTKSIPNRRNTLAELNPWAVLAIYSPLVLLLGFLAGIDTPTVDMAPARQPTVILFVSHAIPSESLASDCLIGLLYVSCVLLFLVLLATLRWPAFFGALLSFSAVSLMEAVGRTSLLASHLIQPRDIHASLLQQIGETLIIGCPCFPIAFFLHRSQQTVKSREERP